jgi:hypothetical protein
VDSLKEIMRVVTLKADIKKVFPELIEAETSPSITATYVRGIIENHYIDDDAAAESLYRGDRSDQRYRTLKSRVYDRLLAALLNLQVKQPEHSLYLTMYYKCSRNTVAAQTLMRFASRRSGVQLAERTLHAASKFHFTDLQITLTYSLRTSMALLRDSRQYRAYHTRLQQLLEIQQAEFESDYLLDQTLLAMNNSKEQDNSLSLYQISIQRAKELRDRFSTNTLNLNYFRLKSSMHEMLFEYTDLIELCDEALQYFATNSHFSLPARVGEFSLMKAIACNAMGQFEAAIEVSRVCISSFTQGGNNWYLALDIGYTSAMNASDYKNAVYFHSMAVNDSRFSTLPSLLQERWATYSAYLYLAYEIKLISEIDTISNKSFRLASFLNSVPEFSKDKKYSNFLVIVSHICFLIVKERYEDAERRAEYLRTYSLRYLKEPEFERARVFVKILLLLSKGIDSNTEIDETFINLLEQLKKTDQLIRGNEVNEIIPYEILIRFLINTVVQNKQNYESNQ